MHQYLAPLLLFACAGYGVAFGGSPERWAAAILVGGSLATLVVLSPMAVRLQRIEIGAAMVDAAAYAAMLLLAILSNRYWTLWLSGTMGVELSSHALGLFDDPRLTTTYAILSQCLIYPMLALLIIGTSRHRSRKKRFGVDASWTSFSSRSAVQPTA